MQECLTFRDWYPSAGPEAFNELPDPDAIFIGGSGRMVPDLVQAALSRMKPGASIVVNVSSLIIWSLCKQELIRRGCEATFA